MAWQIQRTESFDKWWKRENVHDSNYRYYEEALKDFNNISLPHNRQTCHFKNSSFECWGARLPDKMRQQGKSCGFRVVFVLDREEGIILLQGIFRRNHLSNKGQAGKYDEAYEELVKNLIRQFIEIKP